MAVVASQAPIYGDKTQLDQFKKATKTAPISGATVQKRGPGRPAGAAAPASKAQAATVPAEHQTLMQDYAHKQMVAQRWQAIASQPDAGEWAQLYAQVAMQQLQEAAVALKSQTPDWTF